MQTNGPIMTQDLPESFINGVSAGIFQVHDLAQKEATPVLTKIWPLEHDPDAAATTFQTSGGIGRLTKTGQNENFKEVTKFTGPKTVLTYEKFAGKHTITKEALRTNQYKSEINAIKGLSKDAALLPERALAAILNSGFSSTAGADGFSVTRPLVENGVAPITRLFSIAQPIAMGGVQSNVLANSPALSVASVVEANTLMDNTKADSGNFLNLTGKRYLLVPTALRDLATRIVMSSQIQGSNFNDVNTLSNIEVVVSPYLNFNSQSGEGSNTAWYLVSSDVENLHVVNSFGPDIKTWVDEINSLVTTIDTYQGQCFNDYRGIVASKGDGSTVTA